MNDNFSLRLTDLRREKKVSQKEAATQLGVSQALLSHYEKGIRECGLDFLKKACDYYDVTSDYLLGITDSRHGFNDIYNRHELPSDSELRIKTVLRAMVSLSEHLSAAGDGAENRLLEEMLLSVYRFTLHSVKYGISNSEWFGIDVKDGEILASAMLSSMFTDERVNDKSEQCAYDNEPEFIKTIISSSEDLLSSHFKKLLSKD